MIRLRVRELSLVRGARNLFSALSFDLSPGEAGTLVGPNGAGKTSLLRAIAGLLRPAAGAITFHEGEAALEVDGVRERAMHFFGHHDGLKPGRSAREELGFWTRWLGGGPEHLDRAIADFELEDLLALEVRRLSAGQRRRLGLARLIAAPRPLWLLDEPLAPLDAHWRERFGLCARRHVAQGGLILAAVHDPLPLPARAIALSADERRPASPPPAASRPPPP